MTSRRPLTAKPRRGRPPLAKGRGRIALLTIRMTPSELEQLSRLARGAGATVADFVRALLPLP